MDNIIKKCISSIMIFLLLAYTMPVFAFTNEESIYSKLDSYGNRYKTIISQTVENEEGTDNIQTESDKELPIETKVSYELDGNKITAEELAGKSGKVKIILEYENKEENEVIINGKKEKMYTPFLVVSGAIINNDNNRNVEISTGKVINDGSKTIVLGIAFPGMQENLDIPKDDLDLPNKIEITMESTNFEIGNIMSFCTPKILEEGSFDKISDKLDDIYSQVEELKDASFKIEDGAIKLQDGIITLQDGANSLNSGANELNNGVNTLKNGAYDLKGGASKLKAGTTEYVNKSKEFNSAMKQVSNGVNTINANYDQINNGITALNESSNQLSNGAQSVSAGATAISENLGTISTKLGDVQNGLSSLQVGENQLNSGIDNIIAGMNGITGTDNSGKIAEIQGLINANQAKIDELTGTNGSIQAILDLTEDEGVKSVLINQINVNNSSIGMLQANNSALNSIVVTLNQAGGANIASLKNGLEALKAGVNNLQTGTNSLYSGVSELKVGTETLAEKSGELAQGASSLYQGTAQLKNGAQNLSAGSSAIKDGLNTLDNSSNQLLSANNQLLDAATTISKGAVDLENGTVTLNDGVVKLANGSNTLKDGTNTLVSGSNQLSDGSGELVDGIKQFNNDGIMKIYNMVNNDVRNTAKRIEKLETLSNKYNKFGSEISRDEIKFISILDSINISSKEEAKEEIIIYSEETEEKK